MLERGDNNGARGSDRTAGCQNPALVAALLKKGSKMGMNARLTLTALQYIAEEFYSQNKETI